MLTLDKNRRFSLDDKGYLVDKANPAKNGKYKYKGSLDDDRNVRNDLLRERLDDLVSGLFVNNRAKNRKGKQALCDMILGVIGASHLNTLAPAVAVQRPFDGKRKRKREKKWMFGFISISLFIDDAEQLLRELYGEFDRNALGELVSAITTIVVEFTKYVRPDLNKERDDADDIDYRVGISRPKGYNYSSSDHARAVMAADAIAIRAMQVSVNPDAYCRYTKQFVKALDKYWPKLGGWDRRRNGSSSNVDDEKVYYQV
jgi:hypothetical protein